MKNIALILCLGLFVFQRGNTGDQTFSHLFPEDVIHLHSKTSLKFSNETDHDIIALVRGQRDEYLRHVYIRSLEEHTFSEMPLTRFYVQFKSQNFYFEDLERTVMNFGEQHKFQFFYDPTQKAAYKKITEEDFFKH